MRTAVLLTLIMLTVPVLGCLEDAPAPDAGASEPRPSTAWATAPNGVNVTLNAGTTSFAPGEDASFTLTARNDGSDPVEYRDGCAHEWRVTILDPSGNEVDWMGARATCQGFQRTTLDPGETDEGPFKWNGTAWNSEEECWTAVDPGTYTVEGSFTYLQDGSRRYVTASLTVEVTEGGVDGWC